MKIKLTILNMCLKKDQVVATKTKIKMMSKM